MDYRISHVAIGQLVKVFTIMYAIFGVIFVPFFLVGAFLSPDAEGIFGLGFSLFMPILYGVMGALSAAIGGALYNWIAKGVGGIEVKLDVPPASPGSPDTPVGQGPPGSTPRITNS